MAWSEPASADAAVMPGLVAPAPIGAEEALWLAMIVQRLKRAVTRPGSGDRAFIWEVCRVRPGVLSERQRTHIIRLAWRYRFQLPAMLRPACDPDAIQKETTA